MNVLVRPEAAADIEDAFHWYERQRKGLGNEFLAALRETMDLILMQPEAFSAVHRDTKRALVRRRFPYALFFRVHGNVIVIVACMHAKRHPRRWKSRADR